MAQRLDFGARVNLPLVERAEAMAKEFLGFGI